MQKCKNCKKEYSEWGCEFCYSKLILTDSGGIFSAEIDQ
jgi:hypothetical protein